MKICKPWIKLLRVSVIFGALLITLIFLVGAWFSYRGRTEWAATLKELSAKGAALTFEEFRPPPIAPENNFFADPMREQIVGAEPVAQAWGIKHVSKLPKEKRQLELLNSLLSAEQRADIESRFAEYSPLEYLRHLRIFV